MRYPTIIIWEPFQTNMFIVNLAFSDMCMMTTMGLPVVINAFVQDRWMWGALGCEIYAFTGALFGQNDIRYHLLLMLYF